MNRDDVLRLLESQSVAFRMITHPPLCTVEDARDHWHALPAAHTKNLFLKDAGGVFWLLTVPAESTVDLKKAPALIGSKRLSFAGADALDAMLGTRPGSVGPLSLLNAAPGTVRFILDQALADAALIGMHPLDNEATIALSYKDLAGILAEAGHTPRIVPLTAP